MCSPDKGGSAPSDTTTAYSTMLMSACTIPSTQDQYGRGHAAVHVRGQAGNRTNAGRAITPFMFNEENHRVSAFLVHWERALNVSIVCT